MSVKSIVKWVAGILVVAGGICRAADTGSVSIMLAATGTARIAICVATNAPAPERHAADELALYLGKVTGVRFDISEPPPAATPRILIGAGAAMLAEPSFDSSRLASEAIVIETVGRDLILAGGSPRGTLYAVYTFLEDQVGCRWWSSQAETIPSKPTLAIGPLDVVYTPPFEYREPFYFDAFDADWAVTIFGPCWGRIKRLPKRQV